MLAFQPAADSADTPQSRKARLEYLRDEVLMEALFRDGGVSLPTKEAFACALDAVRKDEAKPER